MSVNANGKFELTCSDVIKQSITIDVKSVVTVMISEYERRMMYLLARSARIQLKFRKFLVDWLVIGLLHVGLCVILTSLAINQ